ncbi:recombinase family protein [Novosphingobium flavum]|uniref:Recombinase family protein n=1 Tax=Novosphingobium flavum TaxID=1778672 RepID=A0A7X1FTL0_9SPHN|nr:recombinase family protein [Novosphingobium flavum]MBC2666745.1 recombinase family protein [Novosphingobium flavum]
MKTVRCAIYTRKSSEEGLEQDFNSLDAQREACAAYILSQASEGWSPVAERYDDGGLSGGTLERPALQRLLGDVADGKVDIIVVYKVDRLTRSLLDFAKLVEAFDKAGTSFVSVTQSFNTTTSMGRLTLNMLLSFAQFEREVTAERIRDKLAASKARGMWMGGTPPLGYRPDGRTLAVVEDHAAIIRDIYRRYLELGSVRLVADQLVAADIRSPLRQTTSGRAYGGQRFSRGQLYAILRNPIYVGEIPHKERTYPGNHPPLIGREQWDEAQRLLTAHRQGTRTSRVPTASLLAGRIFDGSGEPLLASHASKRGAGSAPTAATRYRYYVSRSLQRSEGQADTPTFRIPSREIEEVVCRELAVLLDDPLDLAERAGLLIEPAVLGQAVRRCEVLAADLRLRRTAAVAAVLDRVGIHPDRIELAVKVDALADLLNSPPVSGSSPAPDIIHTVPVRVTRTGHVVRLVQDDSAFATGPERATTLEGLLARAHRWWGILCRGETDITTLAAREDVTASYMTRVVRLAFLSPEVTAAALDGRLRAEIDAAALLAPGAIDADWADQERRFLPGKTAAAR